MIVAKEGDHWKLSKLIDWEWAIGGDPIYEFAYFNSPYLFRLLERDTVMDVFYKEYGIDVTQTEIKIKQYVYQMVQVCCFWQIL